MQNLIDLEAVLCLSGLDNYLLSKKFAVQTLLRPLEFVIELISSTQSQLISSINLNHRNLKLGSKLKSFKFAF